MNEEPNSHQSPKEQLVTSRRVIGAAIMLLACCLWVAIWPNESNFDRSEIPGALEFAGRRFTAVTVAVPIAFVGAGVLWSDLLIWLGVFLVFPLPIAFLTLAWALIG
jgi:hypothetical protein